MSYEIIIRRMKHIGVLCAKSSLLLLAACTGALCSPSAVSNERTVFTVATMSEGQAPIIKKFTLHEGGFFVYGYVGIKPQCGRLPPDATSELEAGLEAIRFDQLESSEGWGTDQAQLILETDGDQYIFLMSEVPEGVAELVGVVDHRMQARLGVAYEAFAVGSVPKGPSSQPLSR